MHVCQQSPLPGRQQLDQRCFVRPGSNRNVAGAGEGFGDLRRQAKMAHPKSRSDDAGPLCPRNIVFCASTRKMHYGIDFVAFERFDQRLRQWHSDSAVHYAHFNGDPPCRQFGNQITRTIFSGEIEHGRFNLAPARRNQPDEFTHIAVRRRDVREPGSSCRLRTPRPDGKQWEFDQRVTRRIASNRIWRVRAGDCERAPLSTEIDRNRFYAHQWRHQHVVAARPQSGRGTFGVSLWASHDDTHGSIKKSGAGAMLELASCLGADGLRIFAMPGAGDVVHSAPIRPGDHSTKLHCITGNRCVTRNRSLAGAVERRKKKSFANNGCRCIGVVDTREDVANAFIVLARLNADRALRNGRKKFVGTHDVGGVLGQPKAFEPGKREKRGIDISRVELAQPRLDIAPQRRHTQIRSRTLGDRLPARRCSANARAFRQFGERARLAADEHIARILTLETRR